MTNDNLIKRVEELKDYSHTFLSPEGVDHFLKPFGIKPSLRIAQDTRNEFKGLTLEGDMKEAEGADALTVAFQICDKFNLKVADFYGRGSQHDACCNAIIAHLSGKTKNADYLGSPADEDTPEPPFGEVKAKEAANGDPSS